MDKHLGFVGLGKMGGPMAARLIDAGYALTVCDVRRDVVEALAARGARPAASPRAVADAARTVLLSLPDPGVVREVALGETGVIGGARVRTVIDLSTTGALAARRSPPRWRRATSPRWIAPVSGGVGGASKGTLAVMAACPKAQFADLEPVLKVFGRVFFIGEHPGMGQTMKLANNLLSATAMAATAEALAFGVKAGLDPATMIEVINSGSGRNTASTDKFPRAVLPRTFDFGFTNAMMYKDARLCLEEAGAAGVPMPVGQVVRDQWQKVVEALGGERDFSTVALFAEQAAGVTIGKP
jgi:3-hydroxyisobutyrate dehydrogenase-like beta-hydroxyacid dehydrogenase